MGTDGLRALWLTSSYHPRGGGVQKHVRCVARELLEEGLQVRIATPRWEEDWPEQEDIEGVSVTRLSTAARPGRATLRRLVDWADVVHTHDAYPFLKYYFPFRLLRPRLPAPERKPPPRQPR